MMQCKSVAILSLIPIFFSSGLLAKKKAHSPAEPVASLKTAPQMTADQKVLHALNRLTFGPRSGDLETVKQKGLDQWIEQQLHPVAIP